MRFLTELKAIHKSVWKDLDAVRDTSRKDVFLTSKEARRALKKAKLDPIVEESIALKLEILAPWRATQGIYCFDETLRKAIFDTETKKLPTELLKRLPEWCVYIQTPWHYKANGIFVTFVVHEDGESILSMMDRRDSLGVILEPAVSTSVLSDHVELASSIPQAEIAASSVEDGHNMMDMYRDTENLLIEVMPLILYLCSEKPDIDGYPERPEAKKTSKGMRVMPPKEPRRWEVGSRIGAAIRQAEDKSDHSDSNRGESQGYRPHIRRAHWHLYRHGPGRALKKLRWLAPIPVNVDPDSDAEIITTSRPVK